MKIAIDFDGTCVTHEYPNIGKDIGQETWTDSPKCYAELYIDDAALGISLMEIGNARPRLDWKELVDSLISKGGIVKLLSRIFKWIKEYSANDPVYSCKVYKNIGCSHVDGFLCDMKTCQILIDYETRELEQQLGIRLSDRIDKLPSE